MKTFPWGAVQGYAETHQYILHMARHIAANDFYFMLHPFPSGDQLAGNDYVVPGLLNKTGPGPDADGATPYSWHYFNPRLNQGMAPQKVADYFVEMLGLRARKLDHAKQAAWAAHFLADMFVPYHVLGMYANRAQDWRSQGNGFVSEDVSGPQYLYSYSTPPPVGWGGNGNFSNALTLFFRDFPVGNSEGVDWFDPWYFNGYGGSTSIGVITGSHVWWEYDFWRKTSKEVLEDRLKIVLGESLFDPLWKNRKPTLGDPYREEQAKAAGSFAAACAQRTRDNIQRIYQDPPYGIAMAVRAVYTLFRASISVIELSWRQDIIPTGGYRIVCQVKNTNISEPLSEIDLTLYHEINGRWMTTNPIRLAGEIPPGGTSEAYWDISGGEAKNCVIEVSALFRQTPDLGFASIEFITIPVKKEEMIDRNDLTGINVWSHFPGRQGEHGFTALAYQNGRHPNPYRLLTQSAPNRFDTPEQSGPAGRNNLNWNIPHVIRANGSGHSGFVRLQPSAKVQMGHCFGGEDAVIAWTAQAACRIDIKGNFRLTDTNSNDGVHVYIKLNDRIIWSSNIGTGNTMAQEFNLRQISMNPGNMIFWGVSAKNNDYGDSVSLQAEIVPSGQY